MNGREHGRGRGEPSLYGDRKKKKSEGGKTSSSLNGERKTLKRGEPTSSISKWNRDPRRRRAASQKKRRGKKKALGNPHHEIERKNKQFITELLEPPD